MATQHTTPGKSLSAAYDHERRARAGHESRMKGDPCYPIYESALKCLDDNDGVRDLCTHAFQEFKACRAEQEVLKSQERFKAQEQDPLMGWAFKMYNEWAAGRASAPGAAAAAGDAGPAAAAAAAASAAAIGPPSSSGSVSSSSIEGEPQGWRPPPGEPPRKGWTWQPPPPPRRADE